MYFSGKIATNDDSSFLLFYSVDYTCCTIIDVEKTLHNYTKVSYQHQP